MLTEVMRGVLTEVMRSVLTEVMRGVLTEVMRGVLTEVTEVMNCMRSEVVGAGGLETPSYPGRYASAEPRKKRASK